MPRAAKSAAALKEGRGHRTKSEIERRERAEKSLLSGNKGFERKSVKEDNIAHAEYLRIMKLMKAIGKDDALYSAGINRLCELYSETERYREDCVRMRELMKKLEREFDESDCGSEEIIKFTKAFASMLSQVNKMDAIIMQKRAMMQKLEGENCMTVAAAMRTIPKDAEKKETDVLLEILSSGGQTVKKD